MKQMIYLFAMGTLLVLTGCNDRTKVAPTVPPLCTGQPHDIECTGQPHDIEEPSEEDIQNPDFIFEVVDSMPSYPQGTKALHDYLHRDTYVTDQEAGNVAVQFVVERNGSLSDIQVVRSCSPTLDKEAVRLTKSMPRWVPGYNREGNVVRVRKTVVYHFRPAK